MVTHLLRTAPERYATDLVLPIFRVVAASWLAGTWPSQGAAVRSAESALSAADSTSYAAYSAESVGHESALSDALNAAAFSARSAAHSAAGSAADSARFADAALSAAFFSHSAHSAALWESVSTDATAIETQSPSGQVMQLPLWATTTPEWASAEWQQLQQMLVSLDSNWRVWTEWYDDRLRGAESPKSRPLIEKLELARVLIPDEDWVKGPGHVNAIIADLEAQYRATTPPQRSAIIEVAYGEDGRLHRQPSQPPGARDEAQARRQHAAWQAHSEQLAALEERDPGRNSPAFGSALKSYRAALGSKFEAMDVIKLGVHGTRIDAYAARADETFLEDIASEVVALSAAHGLFIRQFPEWLDYISDASGEPTTDAVDAAINVAKATAEAPDIIGDDVAEAAIELAEAATRPLAANPEDRPPRIVERELLRSTGNILSGMFDPLVKYARDMGSGGRKGSIKGFEKGTEAFVKRATLAVAFGGTSYVLALAAGMPAEFGWIISVLTLLKSKLKP